MIYFAGIVKINKDPYSNALLDCKPNPYIIEAFYK